MNTEHAGVKVNGNGSKKCANIKKTGTQLATALEETEKSAVLFAFEAVSFCTSIALGRFIENNKSTNNDAK